MKISKFIQNWLRWGKCSQYENDIYNELQQAHHIDTNIIFD